MHLLIAFLTALASVLYALERLGVDIGWFNPWSWRRRRQWRKQYHANPAFSLTEPMEAIALLLTATARIDGDLSSEEKIELRRIFEDTFKQTSRESSSLSSASSHLLGSGEEVFAKPHEVLKLSQDKFTPQQKTSSLELLSRISAVSGPPSEAQVDFIARIKNILLPENAQNRWG